MKLVLLLGIVLISRGVCAPITDPALESLIQSESFQTVDILVHFRGPFSKNQGSGKLQFEAIPDDFALNDRFADDQILNGIRIKRIFRINDSALMEVNLQQIRNLQKRRDIMYLCLDREIKIPENLQIAQERPPLVASEKVSDALKLLQIPELWNSLKLKGQGIRIGILDTGYAPHPDLEGKVIQYKDFSSDQQKFDGHGHGTHCLGLMAAGDLSGKALGAAPQAQYLVARVFDDQGKTKLSRLLAGLEWMKDPDGNPATTDSAHIISNSWGEPVQNMAAEKPLWDALVNLKKAGILSVFAAGNEGPSTGSINSPGAFPHALSAGALDRRLQVTRYSSRGPVKWEDVSYLKPDFLAPGSQVESTLPEGLYGRRTGTSISTPLLSAALALIKQAKPNMTWNQILQICRQTALDLENDGPDKHSGWGLLQTFRAAQLAIHGVSVSVQVSGPESSSSLLILPDNIELTTRPTGSQDFFLSSGKHQIIAHSKGFTPMQTSVEVSPESPNKIELKLAPAKIATLKLVVYDKDGNRIPAVVEFENQEGKAFVGISEPMLEPLPQAVYRATVHSRGYRSQSTILIHNEVSKIHSISLDILPQIAIIDDDGGHNLQMYIAKSLDQLNRKFDIISSPKILEDIEGYQIVIWHLGSMGHQTISDTEQGILTDFINHGGSLIISGQDAAYSLQDTNFLRKQLGARFIRDDSKSSEIRHQELVSPINGEYSADNQLFTDILETVGKDSLAYLHYNNGSSAAILKHHSMGKSLLLGFGLEGLPDGNRSKLMEIMLKDLKPSVDILFQKVEWAYSNNRTSYFQMMKSLEIFEPDFAIKVRELVQKLRKKDAWRPVLFEMLHQRRRQIFDQLYDSD